MASAHVADPQSWNRYTYARNNPLRYVDPDGLEVPPDCAKDDKCTIVVKVNVVYDGSANNGKGLNGDQKKKFEQGQIAKAQKEYGTSNIKLDVSYTPGEVTRGADGKTYISGLKNDSLNVGLMAATIPTAAVPLPMPSPILKSGFRARSCSWCRRVLATKDCESFLKNFTGLAHRTVGGPIPHQGPRASPPTRSPISRAARRHPDGRKQRDLEAALAAIGRFELRAAAAHSDRRLALSGGAVLNANGAAPV